MSFTISSVVGAVISLLSAPSVLGANAVSSSTYQILESTGSAAAFIRYATLNISEQAMGATLRDAGVADINVGIEFYVRDSGNPAATLAGVTTLSDSATTAVLDSNNLGNTVDKIFSFALSNPENNVRIFGGQTWLRFDGLIGARVFNL